MEGVSICIPVWNRRNFLPFILRNLMIQDYPKELLEVVIDDDGEEELFGNTEELEAFKNIVKPIKVQYLKYNFKRTIGKKRNNMVIKSSYDTIAMMDSDDLYTKTYISHSLQILKEKKVGMVGTPNMIMLYPPYSNKDFYYLYTGGHKRLLHECSMVFTKKWWKRSPKFEDSSRGEGAKILKDISKVELTDPRKVMIQICHNNNTINKEEFKKNPIEGMQISQELQELIKEVVNYKPKVIYDKDTKLCQLAEKYVVDKCPRYHHHYTPIYDEILKDKKYNKVLEIGIGYEDLMIQYTNENYKCGASLKMWKEYFNCDVYGCDIKDIKLDGIETFIVNQSKEEELELMMNKIGNCDFIIDDGSHILEHQVISFKTLWKYCNDIYIIEDVTDLDKLIDLTKDIFTDCFLKMKYKHPKEQQGFICYERIK